MQPVAKQMLELRMKKTTPEQRKEIARKAAKARWANTTPEERKEHAQRLVEARRYAANAKNTSSNTRSK